MANLDRYQVGVGQVWVLVTIFPPEANPYPQHWYGYHGY